MKKVLSIFVFIFILTQFCFGPIAHGKSDIDSYNLIKSEKLDTKSKELVYNFLDRFEKMNSNKTFAVQSEINKKAIVALDNYIIKLNEKVSSKNLEKTILMLSLLKYELMLKEGKLLEPSISKEKYLIDGEEISLNTNTKVFTSLDGIDINNDKISDIVKIIYINSEGSGIFYYLVADIGTEDGFKGTNGIFIGDRISIQNIDYKDGKIIVNYAKRYPWESFSDSTSVGASKYIEYKNGKLVEQSFPKLNQKEAEKLAIEKWGKLDKSEYDNQEVFILDGEDQIWYVGIIINGLKDDSVNGEKRIMSVHNINGEWKIGSELITEYKCQKGRGSTDFSKKLCD